MARELLARYPEDSVALCGRNAERLDAALADLRRRFGPERVHGAPCDVSSPQDMQRFGEFVGERLGGVDLWWVGGWVLESWVVTAAAAAARARLSCHVLPGMRHPPGCRINNAGEVTAKRLLADVEASEVARVVGTNVLGSLLGCAGGSGSILPVRWQQ